VSALGINIALYGPGEPSILVIFGFAALIQWALAQAPLWGLAVGYGLRLRHAADVQSHQERAERQFGIRQLLVVTAVVAVVLGICRAIVGGLVRREAFEAGAMVIIGMLVVAGIVMMLPLLLAALLPRHALPASVVMLVLIAVGTAAELPLLEALRPTGPGGGPETWHFLAINAVQAFWVLALAGGMRLGGFALAAPMRR
jgi:hypothetical protein